MEIKPERSPEELDSVWPKYGLRGSPYSTSPTRLLSTLPIEKVFSGRHDEVKKFERIITSSNSTRSLIVGDFGVGKTTFANYIRWKLCIKNGSKSKYLTTSAEIKVQPNWDATQFLFSTLSAIYTSSIIFDWKGLGIKRKAIDKLKDYVSIGKQRNFQGSAAGFGGGYGSTRTIPPMLSPEILEDLLISICDEIKKNNKELIIHYNNLENVETKKLADMFRVIRDYIQIDGLHTLFLGPPVVISALEKYGQVHSIFGIPCVLKPLTERNILEILQKRCGELKLKHGRCITPYDETTVKELYNKLNKNIRFTFKVLEDATMISIANAPCKITMDEIKVVQEKEKKEILSTLTDAQLKIVTALLDKIKLSQIELSKITKIGATNLTTPVRELIEKGLIVMQQDERDKRIKCVRLSDNSYLKMFFTSRKVKNKT